MLTPLEFMEQKVTCLELMSMSEFQGRSGPVLQSFVKDHGAIIKTLSDEVLTKFGNVTGEVISELTAADKMTAKVFKSMASFRGEQMAYSSTTEGAFIHARNLPYKFPG